MESKPSSIDSKEDDGLSYNLPSYLRRLANPDIKTVFISGCGGGFDFVHSMTLIPELKRLKKKVRTFNFNETTILAKEHVFICSKSLHR
jgi:hypothetical protein